MRPELVPSPFRMLRARPELCDGPERIAAWGNPARAAPGRGAPRKADA